MNDPRISIAMTTYNGGKYLKDQLDSVLSQTVLPFEIVICDDGSTDGTVDILKEYETNWEGLIHVYQNKYNLGWADNFLKAAGLCAGDWVCFSDQDDVWYEDKIEKIQEIIKRDLDGVVLIAHSADVVDENLRPLGHRMPDFKRAAIIDPNKRHGFKAYLGFSMAFSRRLITDYTWTRRPRSYCPLVTTERPHDVWVHTLANALGSTYVIPQSLAAYRRHGGVETGACDKRGVVRRVGDSRHVGTEHYRYLADVAHEFSLVLQDLSSEAMNSVVAEKLSHSSQLYNKLSRVMRVRSQLYGSEARSGKAKAIVENILMGGYFGSPFYSMGWRSLLKDIWNLVEGSVVI